MFMRLLKLWKLPTPTQLGMGESDNAMGMRNFSSPGDPTWEDYEEKLEELYPVKFFFAHKLPIFFQRTIWWNITRPFSKAYYWIVSHIVPSRRFHMLDLRQPKNANQAYRYGYCDPCEKITLAMMNILVEFVEKDLPNKYLHTEEEVKAEPHWETHRKSYLTAQEVYHYWKVQRNIDLDEEKALLTRWINARGVQNPNADKYMSELEIKENYNAAKLDEMLRKIIDIRGFMWS